MVINFAGDDQVDSYPSKEVLSALSCEALKNPPTASWWFDARLSTFPKRKLSNENQTISDQPQAGHVEDFSAFLAASRPDARAEHDTL